MICRNEIRTVNDEVVDHGVDALSDFKEYLTEQTRDLAEGAKEKVGPLTDRIAPLLGEVVEKVHEGVDRMHEGVDDALDWAEQGVLPKIKGLWEDATTSEPIHDAAERAVTIITVAKSGLHSAQDEIPKLTKKAKKSTEKVVKVTRKAAHQASADAKKALRDAEKAAAVALRDEKKELAQGKKGHRLIKTLGVIALLTAIGFALKQFLSPKDDGWTPQQPSAPYQPRNVMADLDADEVVEDAETIIDDATEAVAEGVSDVADAVGDTVDAVEEKVEEVAEATGEIVDEVIGTDPFRFGEGSYVGENPPEIYTIKGNERSMKYHTPESAGYDRTITDVWFSSEAAAEGAGFVRAQR